jgi:hypothetical protein
MIPLQITIKTYLENKNNQIPTDLQSESKQIKNLLRSEKFKKSEVTPSSPRQLHEVLAATINSEGNGILIDNSKIGNLVFGLPELENNIQEGYVLKPYSSLFFGEHRVILKYKNEKFKVGQGSLKS